LVHLSWTLMSFQMIVQIITTLEELETFRTFVLADALMMSLDVSLEAIGAAEHFATAGQRTDSVHFS